jgi:hypothetical protein
VSQTKTTPHIIDASISTATVDIQVMRIGTKQMTLAVFRQLPYRNIFHRSGKLVAPPWGWVNYDRNGSRSKPFVFSYEGVLYRCDVDLAYNSELVVQPQTDPKHIAAHFEEGHCIPMKTIWVPTGKFFVSNKRNDPYYEDNLVYEVFATESEANAHLANRLKSLTILEEAPQLFIGV